MAVTITYGICSFTQCTLTVSIHCTVAVPLFWSYKDHDGKVGDLAAGDDTLLFHHPVQQLCGHSHQNIHKHWGWADALKGQMV
jgi:hypothetical protein